MMLKGKTTSSIDQMDDHKAFAAKIASVYASPAERVGGTAFIEEARSTP